MLKRKTRLIVISVFVGLIIAANIVFPVVRAVSNFPEARYVVVVDAGHGGRDGGCVGANGSIEKELNLKYAITLRDLLKTKNIKVVMTRENDKALYDENAKNKKISEMKARESVIKKAKPDLVVSIHMNSFGIKSAKGARAFYGTENDKGKIIAECVQKSMHYYVNAKGISATKGDYYILNCTSFPSILVECGYISNPEEEALLNTDDYCKKLMHSVFCGILVYLGFNFY